MKTISLVIILLISTCGLIAQPAKFLKKEFYYSADAELNSAAKYKAINLKKISKWTKRNANTQTNELQSETFIDPMGKLTAIKSYVNSKLNSVLEYKYDSKSNLVLSKEIIFPDSRKADTTISWFEFDSLNRKILYTYQNFDKSENRTHFIYDDKSNCISSYTDMGDGKRHKGSLQCFNKDNQVISEIDSSTFDNVYKTTHEYLSDTVKITEYINGTDDVTSFVVYSPAEDIIYQKIIYSDGKSCIETSSVLDELGRVTSKERFDTNCKLSSRSEFKYDEKGNTILLTVFSPAGEISIRNENSYNEFNMLTSTKESGKIFTERGRTEFYTYEYYR